MEKLLTQNFNILSVFWIGAGTVSDTRAPGCSEGDGCKKGQSVLMFVENDAYRWLALIVVLVSSCLPIVFWLCSEWLMSAWFKLFGMSSYRQLESRCGAIWMPYILWHSHLMGRALSALYDKTLWLWNAELGEAIGEPLQGHLGGINSVAFSSDGECLVLGSRDKTLRLWDAESGEVIGDSLQGHSWGIYGIVFSPDGQCWRWKTGQNGPTYQQISQWFGEVNLGR
jgi:hypothetical protein